jgi:hypothetical protein
MVIKKTATDTAKEKTIFLVYSTVYTKIYGGKITQVV